MWTISTVTVVEVCRKATSRVIEKNLTVAGNSLVGTGQAETPATGSMLVSTLTSYGKTLVLSVCSAFSRVGEQPSINDLSEIMFHHSSTSALLLAVLTVLAEKRHNSFAFL